MSKHERWFMNALITIHLPKAQSAAGVSLIEHQMADGFVVPLHVHNEEDETFYILEGRFRFRVGDATIECGPGESLHVPGGTIHAFRVLSPIARFLTITPGRFEEMVMAASVKAETASLPPPMPMSEKDLERLGALCNQNGIAFVGPPID